MTTNNSKKAFAEAIQYIPGGVNSPVRAFKSVGTEPIFIARAKGAKVFDIDNNEYLDFVASWGPMILGHAQEDILAAIKSAAEMGTSYGAPTLLETEMAKQIQLMMPAMQLVRMVNSGTEATMSAIRLARAYTKREFILKFEGNYHGHADSFLIKAGSGALTLGEPNSPGVPESIAKNTLIAKFNNKESVEQIFEKMGEKIAAVIVEPVAGNMGVVAPKDGFLGFLRSITEKFGTLLIFDEVITGFRLAPGGAQQYFGITPDLTTLGKIIGGGLPVGAYGGKRQIMEMLSPNGPVYQAGTLSGNPLAMAAGLVGLRMLNDNQKIYAKISNLGKQLAEGMRKNIEALGLIACVNQVESMLTLFFGVEKVESFDDATQSDTDMYARYFRKSLESGIYLAPSQFEASFISNAHSQHHIDKALEANFEALKELVS